MLVLGVRTHMIERTIEERHNEDGSTDWRWEFEGASSGWLTCHHEPKEGGAETTTDFEYTVPGSVVGKAADRLLLEKRMRRDFENSLENLKLMVELRRVDAGEADDLTATAGPPRASCDRLQARPDLLPRQKRRLCRRCA